MATVTLEKQITQGSDDMYGSSEDPTLIGGSEAILASDPDFYYLSVFRFQNITIKPGSTILTASLELNPNVSNSSSDVDTTIQGFDEDDTATFTADGAGWTSVDSGRSLTAASVSWTIGNTTQDVFLQTDDITDIVQEIIDRGGWASGNAMGFRIKSTYTAATANYSKRFDTYESSASLAAKLNIDYEPPTSGVSPILPYRGHHRRRAFRHYGV